jgi:hypothetical protein
MTCTIWVESRNKNNNWSGKTYTSCQKQESLSLNDLSPLERCFVHNTPKVETYAQLQPHNTTEKKCVTPHAQNTTVLQPNVLLTRLHRLLVMVTPCINDIKQFYCPTNAHNLWGVCAVHITNASKVILCRHNTDNVCTTSIYPHWTECVILAKYWLWLPDDGFIVNRNMLEQPLLFKKKSFNNSTLFNIVCVSWTIKKCSWYIDYWLIKRDSRLSPAQTAKVKYRLLSQCQYFD